MANNETRHSTEKKCQIDPISSESLAVNVLDSIPSNKAVLDSEGVIRYVNKAWTDFANTNGLKEKCEGKNYLLICESAKSDPVREAAAAADGIRRVIKGELDEFHLKYPCHSQDMERWFQMTVTALPACGQGFVVVKHDLIAEQKQDDVALRNSEAWFDSILSNVPDIIYRLDPEGKITFINDAVRHYGYSPDELIGKDILGLVSPPDREKVSYKLKERRTGNRKTRSFEICLIRKNQDYADFEIKSNIISDDSPVFLVDSEGIYEYADTRGNVFLGTQGVARDITERKQAAEALQLEKQRMQFVIDGSRLGTWEWNVQTNETVFNETWAALIGYTIDELTPYNYETWERLVHPDDLNMAKERLNNCIKGELPDYECEFRMKHKDGHWVWILDQSRVMTRDAAGKPLSMFGTHTDITGLKQNEKRIKESEKTYREIFNSSNDAIFVHDPKTGTILDVNQRFVEMFGFTKDEALRIEIQDISQKEPPYSQKEAIKNIEKAFHEGPHTFEWISRRKSGELFWTEVTISRVLLLGQDRIIAVVREITSRKQAEEDVRRTNDLLRTVLDIVPAIIYVENFEGRFLLVNKTLSDFYGTTVKEMTGVMHIDISEDKEGVNAKYAANREVIKSGKAMFIPEETIVGPDGKISILETHKLPFVFNEEPVVLVVATDITERKHAERIPPAQCGKTCGIGGNSATPLRKLAGFSRLCIR